MPKDNDTPKTRRSVLKSVGTAAAVGTFVASAGTAAADDAKVEKVETDDVDLDDVDLDDVEFEDVDADDLSPQESWYEYKCGATLCDYGSGNTEYRRYCFRDPEAGPVCGSWEISGCC